MPEPATTPAHDPYAALRVPHYRAYLIGNSLALLGRQAVRKGRQDTPGEGDVARLDLDARLPRKRLHDRQQRVGGERGRLVGLGVDDGRFRGGHGGDKTSR